MSHLVTQTLNFVKEPATRQEIQEMGGKPPNVRRIAVPSPQLKDALGIFPTLHHLAIRVQNQKELEEMVDALKSHDSVTRMLSFTFDLSDYYGSLDLLDVINQIPFKTAPKIKVNLSGTWGADIRPLMMLKNLVGLNVSATRIDNASLNTICANNPNLEELHLWKTAINDFTPLLLLRNLKKLFIPTDYRRISPSKEILEGIRSNNPFVEMTIYQL